MLGRGGSWVGASVVGSTLARFWFYQDFAAGSGPNLTITANENGTGGDAFDANNIVDNSAVVTKEDGNPIYSNVSENPATLVRVDTHTADAVLLDATPAVGQGEVRVWYLYEVTSQGAPVGLEIAPLFVREVRSEYLDTRFLNGALNLSDLTDASAARQNLGFTSQTSGQVLLGDGGTTFSSDADLFFDVGNTRLSLGAGATPSQLFHARSDTAPTFLLEAQGAAVPDFRFQAAGAANADLANADNIGQLSFYGRRGGATSVMAEMFAEYMGDGTTRIADFVFRLSNAGAPAEILRLEANGGIKTTKAAGVAYFDADGRLQTETGVTLAELQTLDATSSIQTQLDGKQATGNYITALTGNVVATGPGSVAATIQNNVVTNAMLATVATATFKGRTSGGAGNVEDLSATQATALLNAFVGDSGAGGTKGLVPAPASGDAAANKFLHADGSWQAVQRTKSGKVDLADGDLTEVVAFNTALDVSLALTYTPVVSFRDMVSGDPLYLPYTIIAQDEDGFTVEWNDPIQGNDVDMLWGIFIHEDP